MERDRPVRLTPDATSAAPAPRTRGTFPSGYSLSRLAAVVLLSGAVRSSDLARSIGRSVLDLPLDSTHTILERWRDQAAALSRSIGRGRLDLRVMVDRNSIVPSSVSGGEDLNLTIGQDPKDYRGTAGLLRDISMGDDENSYLLVTNGNQVLLEPLEELAHDLAAKGGDVGLLAHDDGTPMGLMLLRVGALRGVREVGFMDFKEQVLPKLAQQFDVRVLCRERSTGLPVRTLDAYIAALTAHHKVLQGKPAFDDEVGSEQWYSTFALIEKGAEVSPKARIHDSVVLRGARIAAGAVVVRSVVCGSANIKPHQLASDRMVERNTDLSPRSGS